MSQGRAIDPLPLEDFPTEQDVSDPGFEQLFGDLVGIAGTDADGFDDDVAIANSLLDSLDGALGLLGGQDGGTLDDAFAEMDALDPQPAGDDVNNLVTALPDFHGNIDNLGTLITGAALPAPPTPGTGGMKISSATGPILPFSGRQGMGPGACSGYPCKVSSPICNNGAAAIQISSITLVQQGTIWSATTDCTGTLGPNECCSFIITASKQPGANDVAQLQFAGDFPGSPAVFQVDGGIGSSGGAGGGGGGGPIKIACPECG